ncbi:MAG: ATP-binding protein [bacterium]
MRFSPGGPAQQARPASEPPGSSPRTGVIRVVVIAPPAAAEIGVWPPEPVDAQEPFVDRRAAPMAAPMAVETTSALSRLGDPVEILRADDPAELAERLEDGSVDLVLIDRRPPDEVARLLGVIPANGPPSVVVVPGGPADPDEEALSAFREGASDCVCFGPDFERVLPVVLLEQVRRARADRQQEASERHIRWLEDLYAAIVSEMPAGLVVVDRDGVIVATNPEFERSFPARDASAGEAGAARKGERLFVRVPPGLREVMESAVGPSRSSGARDRADAAELVRVEDAESGARAFEVRRRRLDGEGRILLLISEVTESEWLSQRLDSLRRDHREIIENLNSALLVVDQSGRISFANSAAEGILGDRLDALVGRHVGDWFDPPELRTESRSASPIEDCLATGRRSRGAETLLRRADGHWIPVGVSCSPRLDRSGRPVGAVAIFQDLSAIKELELQVRQSEKMASIGQLAAGVAHEVNNPMGFIQANLRQMAEYLGDLSRVLDATDRLQQAVGDGEPEAIRAASRDLEAVSAEVDLEYVRNDFEKALLESAEGAERIRHIVKDLRDFSRPDLPARSPADVNQAVESTANIVWTMMKHSIELEKDLGVLPEIDAYPMQLKQVFMNLLVNACQAIEAREDREPGWVRIETAVEGAEIVVRIRDSGIGIDAEDLPRIFDPFFTTKPVGSGTGLGLSTSFGIIERHGGRIGVESERGEGATFEVRLPISDPEESDEPDQSEAAGAETANGTFHD